MPWLCHVCIMPLTFSTARPLGPLPLPPQVHSSAQHLKLITFDADGTLYADGAHIEHDNQMIEHIIGLMRRWAGGRPGGRAHTGEVHKHAALPPSTGAARGSPSSGTQRPAWAPRLTAASFCA